MRLKPKMLLGTTAISLGGVLLTTTAIVFVVSSIAKQSLQSELTERLVLQRDLKKDQIENYINSVTDEVAESASLDGIFAQALMEFNKPFMNFKKQVPSRPSEYALAVKSYIDDQFVPHFYDFNYEAEPISSEIIMSKLDDNTIALQNYYIADNPNPLGQKDEMSQLEGVSPDYAKVHAKYHPRFRDYLNKWGFYDVFLVDAKTGFVVYSVFKELDYATSLFTGPYADSGLGIAFKDALENAEQGKSYVTKMKPYYPSYNDYAAFVSSPLYINGELQGVFIIQMPLDKINQVMTFNEGWSNYGMGESGETYLVAEDFTMRNDSRFLIEDPDGYFAAIKQAKLPENEINSISKKGTTIGLQHVRSPGSTAALKGESGFQIFPDYRKIPVLSAYAPLTVAGLNWAILAEIDEAEAFAPVTTLINDIVKTAAIIGLILLAVSLLISFFFVNTIVAPITYFKNIIEGFRSGNVEERVEYDLNDEIGELSHSLYDLLDERQQTLEQITRENDALNESVINMLQVASQLGQGDLRAKMNISEDVTGPLADSINMVVEKTSQTLSKVKQTAAEVENSVSMVKQQSDTVMEVSEKESNVVNNAVQQLNEASEQLQQIAELARQCNIAADQTIVTTEQAQNTVIASVDGINNIREYISETEKKIKRLGERSQEIAGVTSIINGIAEKTHVLALNASMQAASAGEAGRGFAVVATEIQRLAESASEATTEISALIKNIQMDTTDTVNAMNKAITQVVEGSKLAEDAGQQMRETGEKSHHLVQLVQQIAASSEQQAVVSKQLHQQANEIQKSNTDTTKQLELQGMQTRNLVEYAADLLKSISAFKLPA